MFKGKRGQELSTNVIILIVLGVIVLAVLAIGFTIGWSKILPFLSSENVDDIKDQCNLACSTGSQFDFTQTVRKLNDGSLKIEATCQQLAVIKDNLYGIEKCSDFVYVLPTDCTGVKIKIDGNEVVGANTFVSGDNKKDLVLTTGVSDGVKECHFAY